MNNWIGQTVKQVWNDAMHVLYNFGDLTLTQQLSAWADTAYKRAPRPGPSGWSIPALRDIQQKSHLAF